MSSLEPIYFSQSLSASSSARPIINGADFAAKITNKVNQTVKKDEHENEKNISKLQDKKELKTISKIEDVKEVSKDYVTDDQFFDDFFADDDD